MSDESGNRVPNSAKVCVMRWSSTPSDTRSPGTRRVAVIKANSSCSGRARSLRELIEAPKPFQGIRDAVGHRLGKHQGLLVAFNEQIRVGDQVEGLGVTSLAGQGVGLPPQRFHSTGLPSKPGVRDCGELRKMPLLVRDLSRHRERFTPQARHVELVGRYDQRILPGLRKVTSTTAQSRQLQANEAGLMILQ